MASNTQTTAINLGDLAEMGPPGRALAIIHLAGRIARGVAAGS